MQTKQLQYDLVLPSLQTDSIHFIASVSHLALNHSPLLHIIYQLTFQSSILTFGMQQLVSDFVMEKCRRWIGHLGCMGNDRLHTKAPLGGWNSKRPHHGPKTRLKNVARSDAQVIVASE